MFFRPKPTIDEDDIDWQFECWQWLLGNLGGVDALSEFQTVLPTRTDFPASAELGDDRAKFVFGQVCDYFQLDSSQFSLVEQEAEIDPKVAPLGLVENIPSSPLGTYSATDTNTHIITYSPSILDNLEALIATFAHEICHPVLLGIPTPPPGEPEAEEFATDLAMVFFGFGIFGGNSSFNFDQFTDSGTGTQGWSARKSGYLTQNEWGFALAVRAHLTGENNENITRYGSSGLLLNFSKNYKYLAKNKLLISSIK